MDAGVIIAVCSLFAFITLIVFHVPLAFALMGVGVVAFSIQVGQQAGLSILASETSVVLESLDFAAVPLFLLMGTFVTVSGFSKDLFVAAAAMLGKRRGSLAYATISGSAIFGAVCGSSPATVATFTRVALPEMLERGYSPGFAGATIAAGGALKSLIPPSVTMIIYCVIAKVFIFDLFTAAIVPALMAIALNLIAIAVTVAWF
ncbi:TRAP transporter large permease subunit, partial [Paraburkholderia aspalathi]|nr:TRAP transporter large permease subunit [Paraburkholderia aspalathi]